MSKGFLGVIVIVILVFAGIVVVSGNKSNTAKGKTSSATLTQHIEGNGKSGVTLVEYGDYECPFCGEYYPTVKQVQAQFNDQIYFQFRNFPLVNIHQNAFAGARAAEAAAMQNQFWQMHDALYETQTQWSSSSSAVAFFNQLAQQLGLNMTKFKADYDSSAVNNLINADVAEGNKLNIQGTPTFFLDGKALDSTQLVDSQSKPSAAAFAKVINAEIAKKAQK